MRKIVQIKEFTSPNLVNSFLATHPQVEYIDLKIDWAGCNSVLIYKIEIDG